MTHVAEILGIVGAVLAASMALPQAVRAWSRGVDGVSAPTYQILMATAMAWAVYGFARGLWLLFLSNVVLTVSCAVVLAAFVRAGTPVSRLGVLFVPAALLVIAVMVAQPTWTGLVAAAYSIGLRFPQLRLLRRASSLAGVSIGTWAVAAGASLCWFLYALINGDVVLGGATAINVVTSVTLMVAVVVARRRHLDAPPEASDVPFLEPLPE